MKPNLVKIKLQRDIDLEAAAALILDTQKEDGEIPWSVGGKTDPWDHVESAMGLNVAGYRRNARKAFAWLADHQLDDGAWYASYRDGEPEDRTLDTNMVSYVAVGVFHDHLITGDRGFLQDMWPTIDRAMEFVLEFQAAGGEVHWAKSPEGVMDPMALLTGSSSVFMSLKCALAVADLLGYDRPAWRRAKALLGDALLNRPHSFNMAKSRYSMDWFYPVLVGALTGMDARRRIERSWEKFVVRGQGILCVSDQPWVTVAETSELVLALAAMGNKTLAQIVFNWIADRTFEDGSYVAGFTFPDMVVWPEEKISWTNAGVLMAADALYRITPGGRLFEHGFWEAR